MVHIMKQTSRYVLSSKRRLLKVVIYGIYLYLFFKRFGVVSQFSFGETDDRETWNGLVELNWSNSIESKVGYIQYKSYNQEFLDGWEREKSASIGARFGQIAGFTWAVQYTREFSSFKSDGDQDVLGFQLKYRWE